MAAIRAERTAVREESSADLPLHNRTRTLRIELSLRSIFSIIGIAIGLWLLVQIWQILLLLIIAIVVAGTLSPAVEWLGRHHVRRHWALGIVLIAMLVTIFGLASVIIPALVTQVSGLIASAPDMQQRLVGLLEGFPGLAGRVGTLQETPPDRLLEPVGAYVLEFTTAAAEVLALGVTTVVLAFYLIADRERVLGFFYALLPRSYHLRAARILLDMQTVVGGYVRGQALTSLLIGIFVYALLSLVGTPNPMALAIIAAFTDMIPFIGGWIALTPAVLATLTLGFWPAAIVFVVIFAYQEFESRVLIPRVYGMTLRLSPVAVTLALLIGFKLLGIVGALLALPLAAGIRVLMEDLRIDLPGEQVGEEAERKIEALAEAVYAQRTEGAPAVEAAAVATELAEQLQEQEEALTGQAVVPAEERSDSRPVTRLPTSDGSAPSSSVSARSH